MPIVSGGGGGGGGPAAGSYWPVGNKTGVTVDSTTYNDTVKGGGAKLTTLVFPSDQGALAVAITGDAFPRYLLAADASNIGLAMGDGTVDLGGGFGANFYIGGDAGPGLQGPSGSTIHLGKEPFLSQAASGGNVAPRLNQLSPAFTITSGALPPLAFVSGTARQVSTTRDAQLVVPVTYNPGVATTATCKVELSADNSTFSEVVTVTRPVGTVFDGQIDPVDVRVPAGWYVKLTVTNATLGTGTYY